jgi:hypothetical protein
MVWHDNKAVYRAFRSVDVQTSFDRNTPGRFWKMPSMVGCERSEDRFVDLLGVRECAARPVRPEHTIATYLWTACCSSVVRTTEL